MKTDTKHILVTTDFSSCAAAAFDAARMMQRIFGARLTLLSVAEEEHEVRSGSAQLADIQQREFEGLPMSTELLRAQGSVPEAISHYAVSKNVDMIVLASHGRSGVERVLFGSVAERILTAARCPVLIVPQSEERNRPNHSGVQICALTDLSPGSERALVLAGAIFRAIGSASARLTVLHVAENMTAATFGSPLGGRAEDIRSETQHGAERMLSEFAAKYLPGALAMTTVIRGIRHVEEEIAQFASDHDVDLLVLAARTHDRAEKMLLGSVAHKLVRSVRRKLLIVPRRCL